MKTAEIFAEYKDHMGTDLTVVNAARTSFGKESDWEGQEVVYDPVTKIGRAPMKLKPADANLIRFLATGFRTKDWDALLRKVREAAESSIDDDLAEILEHYKKSAQHWAPFAHPHMQIRMKLPMFLARQFVKHQIGGVWSEESRRYVDDVPEFWFPKEWHGRPDDIKQGSDGLIADQGEAFDISERATEIALDAYLALLAIGVAPEEARIVLPLNTMTTVTWTGSLLFWSRVCNQRLDSHAQKAANELAQQIAGIAQPLYPVSWAALVGG